MQSPVKRHLGEKLVVVSGMQVLRAQNCSYLIIFLCILVDVWGF